MTDPCCGKRLVADPLSSDHISAVCIRFATDLSGSVALCGINHKLPAFLVINILLVRTIDREVGTSLTRSTPVRTDAAITASLSSVWPATGGAMSARSDSLYVAAFLSAESRAGRLRGQHGGAR